MEVLFIKYNTAQKSSLGLGLAGGPAIAHSTDRTDDHPSPKISASEEQALYLEMAARYGRLSTDQKSGLGKKNSAKMVSEHMTRLKCDLCRRLSRLVFEIRTILCRSVSVSPDSSTKAIAVLYYLEGVGHPLDRIQNLNKGSNSAIKAWLLPTTQTNLTYMS